MRALHRRPCTVPPGITSSGGILLSLTCKIRLSVALTNACELRCAYCYAPKHAAALHRERVVARAVELDAAGCLGVGFGEGEPTAYRRFAQLCSDIAQSMSMAVTFAKVEIFSCHEWDEDAIARPHPSSRSAAAAVESTGATGKPQGPIRRPPHSPLLLTYSMS
ncbi:radical SAM protein [Streptomyces sparsogenes]|uniref:radical SAM protein n=1 Tax=Streptomyces sparsogenes TaxID=67365 RepID=UPI0033D3EB49